MSFREPVRDKSFGEEWKTEPPTQPKKQKVLTQAQKQKGQTWIFLSEPEKPYVVGEKPPSTTILKQPETYKTFIFQSQPERPMVVGAKTPTKADVTLIAAPPSVRAELRQTEYEQRMAKTEASRAVSSDIQLRLYGVQTKLASTEQSLRGQVLIQKQRALGFELAETKQTETGLTYFFVPTTRKGIAQTLLEYKLPGQTEYERVQHVLGRAGYAEKPAATKLVARFVAPFEASFYGVGSLVGGAKKTVETRRPQSAQGWEWAGLQTPIIPGTISGGLVSSGIESVRAGKPVASRELKEVKTWTHEEKMAGLLGEIALFWATGKAVTKVSQVIAKPIHVKAESWLTTKYVEKGPLVWKGWKEKAVMRLTGAKPYVARSEIVLPQISKEISFQSLKAEQVAWEMTQTPRMGGVWLRNLGVAPTKTKVLPHLISRGGAISIGYLRELSFEEPLWKRGLLPYVTQTQVTRSGILPYVPKAVATTGKQGINYLAIGFGVTALSHVKPKKDVLRVETILKPLLTVQLQPKQKEKQVLLPKLWQPTLAYQREKFKPLTMERLQPEQRERLIPVLKLPTLQTPTSELKVPTLQTPETMQKTIQIPTQTTVTIQKTTQIPSIPFPTPQIPTMHTPLPPPFRLPHGGRDVSRRQRGLWGAWFKRTHEIKTAKQMWRTFTGPQRKTRKRKKKIRGVKLFGF